MKKSTTSFDQLGLSPSMVATVAQLGFQAPSLIQEAAIPFLLAGKDLVGQSQTGSGKTAAYAIPSLERIVPHERSPQLLIMAPTRELVKQIVTEVEKFIAFAPELSVVAVYGGASYGPQLAALRRGAQIVVGTPGRLIDHLERKSLILDQIRMVVLDEADRMLDMGFRDEMGTILSQAPEERQSLFFSATLSSPVRRLIETYATDPEWIHIKEKELTVSSIDQLYYEVPARQKKESLLRLTQMGFLKNGIIFCNTQRLVEELSELLAQAGVMVDKIHGGMAQTQRTRSMGRLKKGEISLLVATDVAARGIDIDHLEVVLNYELPTEPEDYVHRIGRTGRAGRSGSAITLLSKRDFPRMRAIERYTKAKLRPEKLPTAQEIETQLQGQLLAHIKSSLDKLPQEIELLPQTPLEKLLEEGYSLEQLMVGLWELLAQDPQKILRPATLHGEELVASSERGENSSEDRWEERGGGDDFSGDRGRGKGRRGGRGGRDSQGKEKTKEKEGFRKGGRKSFHKSSEKGAPKRFQQFSGNRSDKPGKRRPKKRY